MVARMDRSDAMELIGMDMETAVSDLLVGMAMRSEDVRDMVIPDGFWADVSMLAIVSQGVRAEALAQMQIEFADIAGLLDIGAPCAVMCGSGPDDRWVWVGWLGDVISGDDDTAAQSWADQGGDGVAEAMARLLIQARARLATAESA